MIRRRPGATRGDLGHLLGELVLVWRPPRRRSGAAVGAQGSSRGGQRDARWLRNRPTGARRAAPAPPGATPEHAEEPNGGDAEGRRREGEANASRNRRNRLLEKARHVSRRDTAD